MKFVVCHACKTHVQIGGDELEIEAIIRTSPILHCVTPFCTGVMEPCGLTSSKGYTRKELPVRGFYRAINGYGSGEGDPASYQRAKQLLLTKRVIEVLGEPVGQPERVILRQLVLEGGIRLHFETSAKGACLYYIEEPSLSCTEVVEHELATGTDPAGPGQAGKENRRADAGAIGPVAENAGSTFQPEAGPAQPGMPTVSTAGGLPAGDGAGARLAGDHGSHG